MFSLLNYEPRVLHVRLCTKMRDDYKFEKRVIIANVACQSIGLVLLSSVNFAEHYPRKSCRDLEPRRQDRVSSFPCLLRLLIATSISRAMSYLERRVQGQDISPHLILTFLKRFKACSTLLSRPLYPHAILHEYKQS